MTRLAAGGTFKVAKLLKIAAQNKSSLINRDLKIEEVNQEMAATRFASRATLREAARLCSSPLRPALAINGCAARKADVASSLLPIAIASSTRRIDERIWLR